MNQEKELILKKKWKLKMQKIIQSKVNNTHKRIKIKTCPKNKFKT